MSNTTVTSPPQLSRYRSQRRPKNAQIPSSENAQSAVPQVPSSYATSSSASNSSRDNNAMERSKSMSRYHNRSAPRAGSNPTAGTASRTSPPMSPPMDLVSRSRSADAPRRQPSRYNKATSPPLPPMSPPQGSSRYGPMPQRDLSGGSYSPPTSQSPRSIHSSHVVSPQAQAVNFLEREKVRLDKMRVYQQEDQKKIRLAKQLKQAEADKIQAAKNKVEQARKAKEREEAQIAQAAKDEEDMWRVKRKDEAEKKKMREKLDKLRAKAEAVDEPTSHPQILEKIGLFKRRNTPPETQVDGFDSSRPQTSAGRGERQVIKPGGGGIVPLSDAPVSAVNHGDRRVRVVTQDKSVLLPIKNTTTPLQLIRSCVTFFDVPIDPRNTFLMEDFTKCGIQRNLRMYEHIRNILNSWDSDDQHTLTLLPYDSSQDSKLYATWAPRTRPSGGRWTLYLSQERGKWEKRFISMSNDGQITAAKNEDGKGLVNVCHLSDFDVYKLSREGEKKKVKPPKKFCYAVKSLRKSSMFLGDTGFIHMFCSSDAAVAQNFHDTIYRWRCWYLVNVMGEDGQGKTLLTSNAAAADGPLLSADDFNGPKRTSAYVLGSFNNELQLDFQTFQVKEEARSKGHARLPSDTPLASAIAVGTKNDLGLMSASEHSKAVHSRQQSIRRAAQSNPPVSMHNAHNAHQRNMSNNSASRPATSSQQAGSQTSGLQRNASTRSTTRRSLDRAQSTRHRKDSSISNPASAPPPPGFMPKPLIDLTPAYVEPPQHRNKGRGIAASAVEGPLVDSATTQRDPGAIVIPDSVAWRGGGLLARATSVKKPSQQDPMATYNAAPVGGGGPGRGLLGELPGNEGFTGTGLLAPHVSKT